MNLTEIDIRKKYRYSSLSYVFDVYMECEFRANLTQNKYDGLEPGEFRFDYKSWSYRLGFTKKQMERAIKELTTENIVIIQIERGTKGTSSKYFLARFKENNNVSNNEGLEASKENEISNKTEEKKKENNKELNKRIIGEAETLNITGLGNNEGEEKGSEKEKNEEKKKEHSSQHNNNIYSLIFENWISKNIKKHRSLTNDIKKAIDKTLKEFTKDEILEAINNYSVMYNDKSYKWCDYQWGLQEFLLRKDKDGIRQLGMFLNDGSKQINYESWKKEREHNANTNRFAKRDRGVFNKDSENIRMELPKQEHRHYTNEELEALGID
ncbi:hypothetical protein LF65_05661 [Clostridium beijerinckii]|uniref:Replication protein n=1 Tax=Clostridium beijerinckii TaxID=1520 RepID=A0A0B5QW30_CLOBE|nr:hypothetical protein [Clostridium beijerinckii]AJH02168.1 hypothetical protein LF65_05661 [Clostridium beijerinckii]